MRIKTLLDTAQAAGFAMAPNEEVFLDAPAPARVSTSQALVLAKPIHRTPGQAARVFMIRMRARWNYLRAAFLNPSAVAGLLPSRAAGA
jgi:hypothetical protein